MAAASCAALTACRTSASIASTQPMSGSFALRLPNPYPASRLNHPDSCGSAHISRLAATRGESSAAMANPMSVLARDQGIHLTSTFQKLIGSGADRLGQDISAAAGAVFRTNSLAPTTSTPATTNRSTVVSRTFLLGLARYFCFEACSFPELPGRQPFVREPSLRPTNDATNHLGRNMELPCDFGSRMGSFTAKPEVQADYLFLQWAQGLQEH